jgi:hypothetical protein
LREVLIEEAGCIIMMYDVCVFVCFVVSGVAPARNQRICRNIYNLGINITLSRKLLTSKPDTEIGRTIVINSGQRSKLSNSSVLVRRKEYHEQCYISIRVCVAWYAIVMRTSTLI